MVSKGLVWECECGNIEYGQWPPQECSQCDGMDCFLKIPEDEVEDKVAGNVLALRPEEEDE